MKKLKDSIIEYQKYLSEEGKVMDDLFNKYKSSVFAKSQFIWFITYKFNVFLIIINLMPKLH